MIENKKQLGQKQEETKEEQLFRLPKNIRQVGQGEQNFAVYIEDACKNTPAGRFYRLTGVLFLQEIITARFRRS